MSEKVTVKVERHELHLPAIALRGLVVFPNNLVHFEVGRAKSIAAVEWAMANNSSVFLVTQKEMDTDEPAAEDLYAYGVVAEVKQVLRKEGRGDFRRILIDFIKVANNVVIVNNLPHSNPFIKEMVI